MGQEESECASDCHASDDRGSARTQGGGGTARAKGQVGQEVGCERARAGKHSGPSLLANLKQALWWFRAQYQKHAEEAASEKDRVIECVRKNLNPRSQRSNEWGTFRTGTSNRSSDPPGGQAVEDR